jgi:hypothetical protein
LSVIKEIFVSAFSIAIFMKSFAFILLGCPIMFKNHFLVFA